MDQTRILKNHNYAFWTHPPPPIPPLPPENPPRFQSSQRSLFTAPTNTARINWKGKRSNNKRKGPPGTQYNKPPNSTYLQYQNRTQSRRFYHKKKLNYRFAPFAPRNTTSFIIRAKKSGGITSLVSPCPATPAVLPTPIFSPSREVLVDMAKEEWGVDGYGSMKGLIRLRSSNEDENEEEGGGSSGSDVEEHLEVERRLDHDLSRFEMIYPSCGSDEQSMVLESRVDDQDSHIMQLEEENLTLKERVFIMTRELEDLRRRVECLETDGGGFRLMENNNETAESENVSENDGFGDVCSEKRVGTGVVERDWKS